MNFWQHILIAFLFFINLYIFLRSFHECKNKKNSFGLVHLLFPIYGARAFSTILGIFVWADGVIFAPFWMISSGLVWYSDNWYLFMLIISLFWLVRSVGETIYWLNQQFSPINRNPIEKHPLKPVFHNDSLWFVHQITWQCITVLTVISSLYFGRLWLLSLH